MVADEFLCCVDDSVQVSCLPQCSLWTRMSWQRMLSCRSCWDTAAFFSVLKKSSRYRPFSQRSGINCPCEVLGDVFPWIWIAHSFHHVFIDVERSRLHSPPPEVHNQFFCFGWGTPCSQSLNLVPVGVLSLFWISPTTAVLSKHTGALVPDAAVMSLNPAYGPSVILLSTLLSLSHSWRIKKAEKNL